MSGDLTVTFEIHGAFCRSCDARMDIYIQCAETHQLLADFRHQHGQHGESGFIAKISAPPEMVSGQVIELSLEGVPR